MKNLFSLHFIVPPPLPNMPKPIFGIEFEYFPSDLEFFMDHIYKIKTIQTINSQNI